MQQVQSLAQEDPPEEDMAVHSSILAWRIPWTEEPGRVQSTGSQRVGLKQLGMLARLNEKLLLVPYLL